MRRQPNQQRTLNKLPTDLRCRNFVNKHRLSIRISTKREKMCTQYVCVPTELLFCMPPLVVGSQYYVCKKKEGKGRGGRKLKSEESTELMPCLIKVEEEEGGRNGERERHTHTTCAFPDQHTARRTEHVVMHYRTCSVQWQNRTWTSCDMTCSICRAVSRSTCFVYALVMWFLH